MNEEIEFNEITERGKKMEENYIILKLKVIKISKDNR